MVYQRSGDCNRFDAEDQPAIPTFSCGLGSPRPYSGASQVPLSGTKPAHCTLSHHFRPHLPPSKMAEEPESALQLPPSIAAEGEGPTEVSPETATPEPPSSAAVSPGTEEPAGDTKKKSNFQSNFTLGRGGRLRLSSNRDGG